MSTATPPTPYVLVQLQSGEPEYENISREFIKDNIKVTKNERLENTCLSDRFNSELEEMRNHSPDVNLNKCYLYHCTCIEKSRICEECLGQTMSRTGKFGNGFYFSKYFIYFHIFEPVCFDPSLNIAPENETFLGETRNYDAINYDGSQSDLTQFVVYQHRRVKVEYIITFEVDEENKDTLTPYRILSAWKYVAVGLGVGAVGFVATPLIAAAALGAAGFTSGGVAAASTAAAIQATIGNVAAGSAFAMAQSAAATGLVAASTAVMKLFKNKTQTADASQEK
ncbi:hypothetical protein ACJMK2_023719 [Sinanodonta woodiana]|uniref:Uncharacterized protein n=1 Tax=Sinanodonta woodiana TaxID=1069815 RepID=A0ABD3T544_SINWO